MIARPWQPTVMLCAILLAPCVAGSAVASAEDWPRFRGPAGTGVSTETDWSHEWPPTGPSVLWKVFIGTGFSSPVTQDGRVYTMGNANNIDTVWCLDADTGKEIWKHSYTSATDPNEFEGGPTATPTVDGDAVYTLSRGGELICLDTADGHVRWSIKLATTANVRIPAWGFSSSPLLYNDMVLVNVGDAGTAVDKTSGQIVWTSADKDAGYSTAVAIETPSGEGIVLGSARSYVCVDPETGQEQWRQRWLTTFGCNAADALVLDQYLFLSAGYNRGSGLLDLTTNPPELVWKHKDFQNQLSTSVRIGDQIYGVDGDVADGAKLTCMDWKTGEIRWSDDTYRYGALTAAGERLIALSDSGELIVAAANLEKFQLLATHQVVEGKCWTAPVLSNGRLYCRTADGQLVCLRLAP